MEVQHETFIVLRALFLVAGLRNAEDKNGNSKWVLVVSDALAKRNRINPVAATQFDAITKRKTESTLAPLRFLFVYYEPHY